MSGADEGRVTRSGFHEETPLYTLKEQRGHLCVPAWMVREEIPGSLSFSKHFLAFGKYFPW